MNYLKAYINLIRKAQSQEEPSIYEKHHIFPVSIYGKNNYLVKLSPRQHYIAHALLYKVMQNRYGTEHKNCIKMARAFWGMHTKNDWQSNRYINSRLYEKLKVEFYKIYNPFLRKGSKHPAYGCKRSEETKNKQRKTYKEKYSGRNSPMFGKHWYNNGIKNTIAFNCPPGFVLGRLSPSEETRSKISAKGKGRKVSQETKNLIREIQIKLRAENKIRDCSNTRWFTDGIRSVRRSACPLGFRPGRAPRKTKDIEMKY